VTSFLNLNGLFFYWNYIAVLKIKRQRNSRQIFLSMSYEKDLSYARKYFTDSEGNRLPGIPRALRAGYYTKLNDPIWAGRRPSSNYLPEVRRRKRNARCVMATALKRQREFAPNFFFLFQF